MRALNTMLLARGGADTTGMVLTQMVVLAEPISVVIVF